MSKPEPQPAPAPESTPVSEPAPARPDHHSPQVNHPDERKRPRWGRRLFRVGLFLVALLIMLVATGPMLLSTGPGTRLLLAQVNSRIDGHIKIDDLSLAWFSGLQAKGVKYTSGDGVHTVSAGRIDVGDTSLWALATGDRKLGRIVVKDLHGVTIELEHDAADAPDEDGSEQTDNALTSKPATAADGPGVLNGVAFELEVDGLSWRYHAPDITAVDLVSSKLTLSLPGDGGTRLQVAGAVKQGEESGRFDLDAGAMGIVDFDGRLQPGLAEYQLSSTAQQIPVDALSRFLAGRTYNNAAAAYMLGSPERIALLLGEGWLAGEVQAAGTLDALDAKLRVHTQNVDADFALVGDGNAITSGEGTKLLVNFTPEAAAVWLPERGLTMDGPVTLEVAGPDLVLPLKDGAVVLDAATLRGVVSSSDWSLTDADGQRIVLAAPKLAVVAQPLGDELVAELKTLVTLTEPGEVVATAASNEADADDTDAGAAEPTSARVKVAQLFSGEPVLTWRLNNAPTAVVEWLYGGSGGLAAAVGPVVQSADGQLALAEGRPRGGSLAVNWDKDAAAPVAEALAVMPPVAFVFDDAGVVTTKDSADFELRLKMTEHLGDFWMGQVHPILFDAKSADRPIRIVVDGATFACPLGPGALTRARIDASLDLGTVQFGPESLLASIVEWTGHPGEQAKFSPAQVTLRDGVLRYEQLALTVGNVDLRFQGAVDLVGQTLEEMSVRVPAESLVKVFQDLEDVVEPGDELVIPMRGALREPEVDLESFRGEIIRLLSAAPRRELEREMDEAFGRAREEVEEELGEEGGELVEGLLRRFLGGRDRADE